MSNPAIRALIFDFGGVLVHTASEDSRNRLAAKFGLSSAELDAAVYESQDGKLAEIGVISSEEHWRRIFARFGVHAPEDQEAFMRDFYGGDCLDEELVERIRAWRGPLRTAMLSNASDSLDRYARETLHLDEAFDEMIISAQVGVAKPDAIIYRLALDRLQVCAQEAVFVDDRADNVAGAAALGIHAIQFDSRDGVLTRIERLIGASEDAQG